MSHLALAAARRSPTEDPVQDPLQLPKNADRSVEEMHDPAAESSKAPELKRFQLVLDSMNFAEVDVEFNGYEISGMDHEMLHIKQDPFLCRREGCVFETSRHADFAQHLYEDHYGIPFEDLEQDGLDPRVEKEFKAVRDDRKGYIYKPFWDRNTRLIRFPLAHPIVPYVTKGLEFLMDPVPGYPTFNAPTLGCSFGALPSFIGRYDSEPASEKSPTPSEGPQEGEDDDGLLDGGEHVPEWGSEAAARLPAFFGDLHKIINDKTMSLVQRVAILMAPDFLDEEPENPEEMENENPEEAV